MRINNNVPFPEIQKAYNQQKKAVSAAKETGSNKDGIELSTDARLFSVALQGLRNLPETSPAKLAEFKDAVKTGTYQVSNEDVAEKIWQESILDKRI